MAKHASLTIEEIFCKNVPRAKILTDLLMGRYGAHIEESQSGRTALSSQGREDKN